MKKFLILLFLLVSALIFTQCVNTDTKETWAIVLHGGAGSAANMSSSEREHYLDLLNQALETGTTMLEQGAQAIDVAMQVVVWMEDCPDFNAGKGAVINSDGIHELDAALMDGRDLKAGAVALSLIHI